MHFNSTNLRQIHWKAISAGSGGLGRTRQKLGWVGGSPEKVLSLLKISESESKLAEFAANSLDFFSL